MAGRTPGETVAELVAGFNAGDAGRVLGVYHADGVFVAEPGKAVNGSDAVRGIVAGFAATKGKLTVEVIDSAEAGDVAVVCTRWVMEREREGGIRERREGNGIVVMRKEGEEWRVAIENPWGREVMG